MQRIQRLRGMIMLCLIFIFMINFFSPVDAKSEGLVYHVPLRGEINQSMFITLKHAFGQAVKDDAELIILEIDSFGGYVDASDNIKNLIYDTPIPVYAYVKKAISGGAYVALACDGIYMLQGSTLGAVEPVAQGQPVTDEKTLSVIDGQMQTMAERQGRDPLIASAMVRKEISIPGVVEAGRLLTLTASKAKEVGYAEGVVSAHTEIPGAAGITSPNYVVYTESWAAKFSRFVSNPVVAAILLAVGLAALVIEVFTAGFGIAGTISLIAFAIYFGGHLVIGFSQWEYIAVFVLGIILLIAEAFAAGFGILGVAGLVCVALSIILSAPTLVMGLATLGIALLLSIIIISVAFRFLRKSSLWNRLILGHSETKEMGYVGPKDLSALLGVEGIALTPLRPSGTVSLADGQRVDAISEGSYIAAGTEIVVRGLSSGSVIVSPK